jgi:hypothetical protein
VNDPLSAKRRQQIIRLCLPAYVPLIVWVVAYGAKLLLGARLGHQDPVGLLGATLVVVYLCTGIASMLSCAIAPISSLAALILFWKDPWRDQRLPEERSRLLLLVLGSGVAWVIGLGIFSKLVK